MKAHTLTLPRQQEIAAALEHNGDVSVADLARRFRVSEMTIRRDLQALADSGRVIRTHGGATAAPKVSFEFEFLRRRQSAQQAKEAIGSAAAGLVKDGQTVMLDSGTSTLAVAQHLKSKQHLTVITTSLPIASALQFCSSIRLLLLGGFVRADSPDLSGGLTESNLERLRADVAIIGAEAIDLKGFVYHASLEVVRLVSKMAQAAQRVYVVADSAKLGRTALARTGHLKDWDGLITDRGAPATTLSALRRAGARIIKAQ